LSIICEAGWFKLHLLVVTKTIIQWGGYGTAKKILIGDLLLQNDLITTDQLEYALTHQKKSGRKLGRVLVDNGFLTEGLLSETLAKQLDLSYINLKNYPLNLALVRLLPGYSPHY